MLVGTLHALAGILFGLGLLMDFVNLYLTVRGIRAIRGERVASGLPVLPWLLYSLAITLMGIGILQKVELVIVMAVFHIACVWGLGTLYLYWFNGRTRLHRAVLRGSDRAVRKALGDGSEVNVADKWGITPLHIAAQLGRKEVAGVLIESGAGLDAKDRYGRTPLLLATAPSRMEVARILVESGACIDEADCDGNTPLLFAALEGNEPLVKYLLEHGADVRVQNEGGMTPMAWAKRGGYSDIVRLLENTR